MSNDDDEGAETVVLRFFNAASGPLRCRVTDVKSHETWIAVDALILHDLVHKRVVLEKRETDA